MGEKEDIMTLKIAGQVEKFKKKMHLEFDAGKLSNVFQFLYF